MYLGTPIYVVKTVTQKIKVHIMLNEDTLENFPWRTKSRQGYILYFMYFIHYIFCIYLYSEYLEGKYITIRKEETKHSLSVGGKYLLLISELIKATE